MVASLAAAAEAPLDGLPVVRIVVDRHNIFDTADPVTSAWPYRAANALHVVTRDRFIRSMLLFEEGEVYSESEAAESARLLRSLGFLNPVEISARRVEDGVEVTVETHDQWSLEIGAELGAAGDRSERAASFTEENFLGWGREVSIEWESTNERDSWTYELFDPNILGSRWRARVEHEDSTDGYRDRWRIDRPFYSLATPTAWGVDWRDERLDEHLYSESRTAVRGRRIRDSWLVWGGIRLPGNHDVARRLIAGYDYRRMKYEDWRWQGDGLDFVPPAGRRIGGIRLGYEQEANNYAVLKGFRAWSIQEDVALGPNFSLGFTASLPELGGDRRRILVDGRVSAADRRRGWLLLGDAWFSGRIEDGEHHDWVGGVQLAAAELGPTGWQARLLVEDSHRLGSDRQLALGAEIGLRGWDPDFFDGTGRALLNVQWRRLLKEDMFQVVSIGLVLFADAGYTWGARVGPDTDGVRTDAGFGVILDLARIGVTNLLRIDAAMPDDGSGVTVTVSSSALF